METEQKLKLEARNRLEFFFFCILRVVLIFRVGFPLVCKYFFISISYFILKSNISKALPWWHSGQESACQCRGHGFDPSSGEIPHTTGQLSPSTTTTEPTLQSLCSAIREATTVRSLRAATREKSPLAATRQKPTQQQRPSTAKNIKNKNKGRARKWDISVYVNIVQPLELIFINNFNDMEKLEHSSSVYSFIYLFIQFIQLSPMLGAVDTV